MGLCAGGQPGLPGNINEGEAPSGSGADGTAACSLEQLDDRLVAFLNANAKKRAPNQSVFDLARKELRLQTADSADREKILSLIRDLGTRNFQSPSEAASRLVLDYDSYYQQKSAKRERALRSKGQTLRPPKGNEQQNDKMRCPGHPHIERRVEGFGPVAFPAPPSSSGACLGGVPPEIGLEALALPTSRLLMAVGHDYYKKVKMNLSISHGGVCIFMLGVLLSCDPMAYVRPVAHASYSICSGRAA
ncbi:hypothetical protein GUJ93_ZPchr0138g24 [Zizania palustris]|uniref:Uncharacterized protein n=1 Tax=Zizania palustris TaxID=103762 RepID=A0A8J5RT41_ZIZPA|nr:hypothetical protein GUJ93_ZPchr0138g24 [Zizania palustris]